MLHIVILRRKQANNKPTNQTKQKQKARIVMKHKQIYSKDTHVFSPNASGSIYPKLERLAQIAAAES